MSVSIWQSISYRSWSCKDKSSTTLSLSKSLLTEALFHFDGYHQGRLLVTEILSQDTAPCPLLRLSNSFMRFSTQRSLSLFTRNFASVREIHSGTDRGTATTLNLLLTDEIKPELNCSSSTELPADNRVITN